MTEQGDRGRRRNRTGGGRNYCFILLLCYYYYYYYLLILFWNFWLKPELGTYFHYHLKEKKLFRRTWAALSLWWDWIPCPEILESVPLTYWPSRLPMQPVHKREIIRWSQGGGAGPMLWDETAGHPNLRDALFKTPRSPSLNSSHGSHKISVQ